MRLSKTSETARPSRLPFPESLIVAGDHKDDKSTNAAGVYVRQANKLSRDTRKHIVDKALATKDQDQYRFLKLIKDRMDAYVPFADIVWAVLL